MAKNNIITGVVVNGATYDFVASDDNLATIETDASNASKAYAVGDHLILDGQYYIVTAAIAQGDAITIGINVTAKTVGEEVSDLRTSFSNALTSLKNTAIAQAVGAVGTTFTSVIASFLSIKTPHQINIFLFVGKFNFFLSSVLFSIHLKTSLSIPLST